jgi:hypothetical protein
MGHIKLTRSNTTQLFFKNFLCYEAQKEIDSVRMLSFQALDKEVQNSPHLIDKKLYKL